MSQTLDPLRFLGHSKHFDDLIMVAALFTYYGVCPTSHH
jgi:hypothetical protein